VGRDAICTILHSLVTLLTNLPLAYLRGFVVEHRYGLSNQRHRDWLVDLGKGTALGLACETPIAVAAYAVIRRSPRWWWLILSGAALPFTVLLAQLYPVLIAPIFNRFVPVADPALVERIRVLAARAGVRVAAVTRMDMSRQTRKVNAFFAGLGPTNRIALATLITSSRRMSRGDRRARTRPSGPRRHLEERCARQPQRPGRRLHPRPGRRAAGAPVEPANRLRPCRRCRQRAAAGLAAERPIGAGDAGGQCLLAERGRAPATAMPWS
jgi:hypothetical protein